MFLLIPPDPFMSHHKQVTDLLALKKEERQGPTYPHPPRFRPPDVKERTKVQKEWRKEGRAIIDVCMSAHGY